MHCKNRQQAHRALPGAYKSHCDAAWPLSLVMHSITPLSRPEPEPEPEPKPEPEPEPELEPDPQSGVIIEPLSKAGEDTVKA